MQIAGVDDVTHSLDALDELGEVVDHLLALDDLGVAGESGRKQALVYQRFEAHHDRVIWARERNVLLCVSDVCAVDAVAWVRDCRIPPFVVSFCD